MKKINKFFSSCSKLTRYFILAILTASLVSGFVSCKRDSGDDNEEPEVYTAQPEHSRSCGAYALAYYLAKTEQIKYSEIETKAEDIYANGNVQFPDPTTPSITIGEDTVHIDCSGYSDPSKLKAYIDSNSLATSATLKLISTANNEAETILIALAAPSALDFDISAENRIENFEAGFTGCDYCIEILKSGTAGLHYVLTYKKGNEFYTRDPDDGKEYKRSEIKNTHTSYEFSNSGIFIKK